MVDKRFSHARVVKLVDAGDSKSPAARRAGSSPASGTNSEAASVPAEAASSRLEINKASNWLLTGSLRGTQRAAAVMSQILSAKLNGHGPYVYPPDMGPMERAREFLRMALRTLR